MDWGTNVVGGVKPGIEGEHLGKPIFPSVRAVSNGKAELDIFSHFAGQGIC